MTNLTRNKREYYTTTRRDENIAAFLAKATANPRQTCPL